MWRAGVTTTFYDQNAFNIDHGMDVNGELSSGTTLIPEHVDSGFAINVAPGSHHGVGIPHSNPERDPNFFDNHAGINERVDTVHQVFDANFIPTAHHGPIHNSNSRNDVYAKREGCVAGICADLDTNNPDEGFQTHTHHGIGLDDGHEELGQQLPGYKVQVDHDNKVHVVKVENGEETEITSSRRRRRRKSTGPSSIKASTTTSKNIVAGSTTLSVSSGLGFVAGDTIVIGGTETKLIIMVSGGSLTAGERRLQEVVGCTLTVDTPIASDYPAGTTIDDAGPQPQFAARAAGADANAATDEGSSSGTGASTSSAGHGWLILGLSILCICCVAAVVGFLLMSNNKSSKKKKKALDREAYLKNDFIERQPVYSDTDVPASQEEPLMAVEAPVVPPLQPTGSFPLQQTVFPVASTYATAAPMASFPGMPPIGTGSMMQPRTTSMTTAVPYGGSTYVTGGSTYMQQPMQQLGLTTNLQSFPQYR
jgi:hypothetical protein